VHRVASYARKAKLAEFAVTATIATSSLDNLHANSWNWTKPSSVSGTGREISSPLMVRLLVLCCELTMLRYRFSSEIEQSRFQGCPYLFPVSYVMFPAPKKTVLRSTMFPPIPWLYT
jgi:hypothetical protein